MNMLDIIEKWVDQTNSYHKEQRISCDRFVENFKGYYSEDFLKKSYFVVLDNIPKIDLPELRELGFGNFIDMPANGITYKNTYYITPSGINNLRLHFHELVHIVQWQILGAENFITRYMTEIKNFGYNEAPLEIIAYGLDEEYTNKERVIDVSNFVTEHL